MTSSSQVTEIVRLPEGSRVLGDYVTGSIENGNLRLDVWRVGAEVIDLPEPRDSVIGDFTDDRTINVDDITRLCQEINVPRRSLDFDMNNDNRVDRGDLDTLVHDLLETSYGDANLDGQFDSDDIVNMFIAGRYLTTSRDPTTWDQGDWNCDGVFDQHDIVEAFIDSGYVGAANANSANETPAISVLGAAIDQDDKSTAPNFSVSTTLPRVQRFVARRAAALEAPSHDAVFVDHTNLDDRVVPQASRKTLPNPYPRDDSCNC